MATPEVFEENQQESLPATTNKLPGLVKDVLETLLIALVLFVLINSISARIRVESVSMEPTLFRGDFVLIDRLSYWIGEPKRGEIVVFFYPPDPSQRYIKRVIGLPGDDVEVANGVLRVNGEKLNEAYIKAYPAYTGQWSVPENSIFVLGDNRNRSNDSHIWGMVPEENIIGRALFIYWPINRIKSLIPD
jgi:signal peptidase I